MADFERYYLLASVLLVYALLCFLCARRYRTGRVEMVVKGKTPHTDEPAKPSFLVAYASQSGQAAALAQRSTAWLDGQLDYQILPLNQVDNEVLNYTQQALFVVSTYGDGEPPDNGQIFANRYLGTQANIDLSHLQFSVLALGDKLYQQFCAFGHKVQQGLSQLGAMPLSEPIEACASQGYDPDKLLQQWQQRLNVPVTQPQQTIASVAIKQEDFNQWQLHSRRHLNPGSPGAPVFQVCLLPTTGVANWQAGDLVEISLRTSNTSLSPVQVKRKYSIASLPQDGRLELVVRQHINQDGSLGAGSGWLTEHAPLGGDIRLRICQNPAFHGLESDRPMILIGSGTGLAGLRAHIKQRAQQAAQATWLVFGERSPEYDDLFADEILSWQQTACLSRVDYAFSRHPEQPCYVQDRLYQYADELKKWIKSGAAIYVCGNRLGMAQGVDQALQTILGAESYQHICTQGLYRRDIY